LPKGFFSQDKVIEESRISTASSKNGANCYKCGLYKHSMHGKMKYSGFGKKKALIVAEAPGVEEDRVGTQLVGKVGQKLRKDLKKRRFFLDRDFYKINSVNCLPLEHSGSRKPTPEQIICCRPKVEEAIEELNPDYIWLLGGVAVESFYRGYFNDNLSITRWRGLCIPDQRYKAHIMPLYHPSYIERNLDDPALISIYQKDLDRACLGLQNCPVSEQNFKDKVRVLFSYEDVISVLSSILSSKPESVFIDFETTGKKPFKFGHKLLSMSIMPSDEYIAYSFPLDFRGHFTQEQLISIFNVVKAILVCQEIGKAAQNIKFEHLWAKVKLGITISPWIWDTNTSAHIEDNRAGYSGLNFQAYINFGVLPYDGSIKKFKEAPTANDINTMEDLHLPNLLLYGGYDSLFGGLLHRKQDIYIKNGRRRACDFFLESNINLAEMQYNGICADEEYYHKQKEELGRMIVDARKELDLSPEADQYKAERGREIDFTSDNDILDLYYNILKAEKIFTKKGNLSIDKHALERINLKINEKLLFFRKLQKVHGTYLKQFMREITYGKMHPFYDLVTTITFRSSSYEPNFQNIPVRDDFSMNICRGGIVPSVGNRILEADFKGIEVAIGCCYHKDKNMIEYVTDSSTDMHRDVACDIWMLPPEEISKNIRRDAKGGWTFPQFYGSYYEECARNLWRQCLNLKTNSGITLKKHLKQKGIDTFHKFVRHCQEAEYIFWRERFREYDDWKEKNYLQYCENGYIETFFGFKLYGHMSKKDTSNYQIQGTAFHCLLWTMNELMNTAKEENWKSRICGQIHDSLFIDLVPEEKDHIINTIKYIGTEKIREKNEWINVPLSIDFEITPINGSWNQKEEIKT